MLRTSPWRCQDSGVRCQVTNLITSSKACMLQLDFCQRQRQRKTQRKGRTQRQRHLRRHSLPSYKFDKTSFKACSLQPSDDRPRFQHFFLRRKIPLSNLSAFTLAAMSRSGIEILTTCGRILRKFPILRRLMIICWQDGGGTDRPDGCREKKWSAGEIDGKWVSKVKMRWWLLINTLMRLLMNTLMRLLINTSLQSDWWGATVRQGPNFLSLFPFGANIICFHFPSVSKTTLK